LQGEDPIEVFAAATHKCTAALRRRYLKTTIEFVDVVLAEETIGGFQGADLA
jgi:hypothetical protein